MRIRKHAKVSPFNLTPNPSSAADAVLHITVCQLNQSRWDVMTFPQEDDNEDPAKLPPSPPPFLVDRDYYSSSYTSDRTFGNHIAAGKSTSKKEKRHNVIPVAAAVAVVGKVSNKHPRKEDNERPMTEKDEEEMILCSRTDKKGWQCGEIVKIGHSFCDKHLPKSKIKESLIGSSYSQKSTPSEDNRRRLPRSRKPTSSPHEFYYYSWFGPRWGKRRRGESCDTTVSAAVKQETNSSLESGSGSDTSSASREPSVITEDGAENGGPKLSSNSNGRDKDSVFSQFESHGLDLEDDDMVDDFDGDDDYEDDGVCRKIGMKRGRSRKPVKARSLKSLM